MPRPSKPPRLYLRAARPDAHKAAVWVIKDGSRELGTGCGAGDRAGAEVALGNYIIAKHAEQGPAERAADRDRVRDLSEVLIADVLATYAAERVPFVADPISASHRIESLLTWWGVDDPIQTEGQPLDKRDGSLSCILRSTCKGYVTWRTAQRVRRYTKNPAIAPFVSDQTARRELEDLSSAIVWYTQEHPLTRLPVVTLPPKAESPRDALTRDQAARLLKASLGYQWNEERQRWIKRDSFVRTNRLHLRRFLMLGLYTGTRHTVILRLLWSESPVQAWVDLDHGVIYRRGKTERDHKTKRRPICQIPPRVLSCLRRWKRLDDARQARLQQAHLDAGGDPARLPQIQSVIHFNGRPLDGRIRSGFEGIVKDAGLSADITPHWMRHSCATWLMQADAKPWIAAGFMGMSMKTLEDIYGHHRPGQHAEAHIGAGGRRR